MKTNRTTQLLAAAVLGIALAGAGMGVAGPAVADDDPENGIDVTVTIEPSTTGGQVSMTVADNGGVSLQEDGSNAAARQFVGTLPTVTVTDSRRPEEIPAGDYWAVVGQAGEFTATSGSEPIGPQYLGWRPHLLSDSSTGAVEAGEPVSSVISDGSGAPTVGLRGQELLVSTANSADEIGTWEVNADLALRTPVDVAAGEYHSTLTLSLFNQS
ncbi:hypothetical protein [Nonomuraea insulae]|uniref:WxL domain-containing protein n=1 Tax=Nonomuraea insulae TaxID=1616787 RepID=A0ABW1CFY0_9ACTN